MDSGNSKIITLSFMILGILTWVVLKVLIETAAGMVSGGFGRALNSDFSMHVFPVLVGVVLFALLQFNKRVNEWAGEVVAEIRKVVWPSRKDTVAMTIVVCIMLLVAGFIVGGFDIVSAYAIDALLNFNV